MNAFYAEANPKPDQLIEGQLEQVRKIAHFYHGRVRGAVEVDDLIQVGYVGLVDAAQRYVRKENVTFASYAKIRIRGAIVDHLRRASNLCRTTIAHRQQIKKATETLERRLQRTPTANEIADEIGMSVSEYETWRLAFEANSPSSIDEILDDYSMWFHRSTETPEDEINKTELKAALRKALEKLSQREALVIQLYYVEELNVYEIAEILDVTTGRVSQIKKSAIHNLRDHLAALTGETVED